MAGPVEMKWMCFKRTVSYVGWALFWLLLWDVAVTVDAMLFAGYDTELPSCR